MKRHLSTVVLTLVVLLVASLAVQASSIPLRSGYWKTDAGGGRLVFEDGIMHVRDYGGWKLIQYGTNTDAGQFSLPGVTGLLIELKVAEPTDFELAIQLADWAFQPVKKLAVEPSDDWIELEFDLTGYDLSVINALCLQSGGADFSIRSIKTLPLAAEGSGAVAQAANNVKFSGKTTLDITASRVLVVKDPEVQFKDWYVEGAGGTVERVDDNHVKFTGWAGWGSFFMWDVDVDLTKYAGIQFEMKIEDWSKYEVIFEPGWDNVFEDNPGPSGWLPIKLLFEDLGYSEEDVANLDKIRIQLGDVDWAVRNLVLIEKEPEYKTDIARDYGVELNLAYTINEDWAVNVNSKLSENSFQVGLVEVKGLAGDVDVRAFVNGTGANLGDPMQAVRGDKYNHGKTAGINLKGPIGGGSGHFFLSTPVKPDAGKTYFAGASYNLPVYDGTEMQVLGATEFVDGTKNDYILGAVITTKVGDDLALTGQAVASGINAFGFYGKANWKKLEAGVTYAPENLWTKRGNFIAQDGYRIAYLSGNTELFKGVSAGFYLNQYWNLKAQDAGQWKTRLLKLNADWQITDNVKFDAVYEQEKRVDNATGKYDILQKSSLVFTLNAGVMDGLNAKLINIYAHEEQKELQIPAFVGRLTYTGIDKVTLVGEVGRAKANSAAEKYDTNLYGKAKWDFAPGGYLEFGVGKPTLNSDDNAVANRVFEKGYYTLKFGFSF